MWLLGLLMFFLIGAPVITAWGLGIGYLFEFFNKWGAAHEIFWCTTSVLSGPSCGWSFPLAVIIGLIGGGIGVFIIAIIHRIWSTIMIERQKIKQYQPKPFRPKLP